MPPESISPPMQPSGTLEERERHLLSRSEREGDVYVDPKRRLRKGKGGLSPILRCLRSALKKNDIREGGLYLEELERLL